MVTNDTQSNNRIPFHLLIRPLTEVSDTAPRLLASVVGITKELKRISVALYYRDQTQTNTRISKPKLPIYSQMTACKLWVTWWLTGSSLGDEENGGSLAYMRVKGLSLVVGWFVQQRRRVAAGRWMCQMLLCFFTSSSSILKYTMLDM